MRIKMLGLTSALCLLLIACQPELVYVTDGPTVSEQDFSVLAGDWEGTLTYTDYGSGELTVIASTASVTPTSEARIDYTISYPDESWEDSASTMTISEDGRLLDGNIITARMTGEDGELIVTTQYRDEDDNRPSDLRYWYEQFL